MLAYPSVSLSLSVSLSVSIYLYLFIYIGNLTALSAIGLNHFSAMAPNECHRSFASNEHKYLPMPELVKFDFVLKVSCDVF